MHQDILGQWEQDARSYYASCRASSARVYSEALGEWEQQYRLGPQGTARRLGVLYSPEPGDEAPPEYSQIEGHIGLTRRYQ